MLKQYYLELVQRLIYFQDILILMIPRFIKEQTQTQQLPYNVLMHSVFLNNVSTEIPAVPGAIAGQLTGTRIETLLDFVEFPDSLMLLNPGQTTCQVDPGGNRSILQAIQTVEQTEFGAFFIGRDGKATFFDRNTVSLLSDVPTFDYTDTRPLPSNSYPYQNIDFNFDDQLVLNDVSVTRIGGTPQTVTDQASIDTYYYKSGTRTDLLMQSDIDALNQAQMLVVVVGATVVVVVVGPGTPEAARNTPIPLGLRNNGLTVLLFLTIKQI